MGTPSAAHFIYIPVVLIFGIVLGFILGGRAARDHYETERRKAEDRERRKAERAAQAPPGSAPAGEGGRLPERTK
jgi:hypothetical protein